MALSAQGGYTKLYPTGAPAGGSTVLAGNGSSSDIFTFSRTSEVLMLQNNVAAAGTVRVAWDVGAVPAAPLSFYDITVPNAGNELLTLNVVADWVAIYGLAGITVNNGTAGLTVLGGY